MKLNDIGLVSGVWQNSALGRNMQLQNNYVVVKKEQKLLRNYHHGLCYVIMKVMCSSSRVDWEKYYIDWGKSVLLGCKKVEP